MLMQKVITMIRKTTIFLFFTLLSLSSLHGQVSVKHYDLDYELNFDNNKLFGIAKLGFNGQADTLNLLLYRLLKVTSIKDDLGRSVDFRQEVVSLKDFEEVQVNHIQIPLADQKNPTLTLGFNGYLLGYSETPMKYIKDHISPNFTIIRMDAYGYPVFAKPSMQDIRANALVSSFDYRISVTIPDSLKAATLGKLIEVTKQEKKVKYTYQSVQPSWRMDVAVWKYATLQKDNFKIHYFKEDSIGAQHVLRAIEQSSEFYTSKFGIKDLPEFTVMEIEDGYGSQADRYGIIQTATAFRQTEDLDQVYHEVAHLWNIQPTDKSPCRLESEGLSVFLQSLVKEKVENKSSYLAEEAQSIFNRVKRQAAKNVKLANTPIIEYGEKNMTGYSYTKGMLFFYLLYNTVGEDAFFKAIKGYYTTFEKTGSTTKEFAEYLENSFKSDKVSKLLNDWIFTAQSTSSLLSNDKVDDLWK